MSKGIKAAVRVLAVVTLLAATAGEARAADEQATGSLLLTPQTGQLFQDAYRPVDWAATVTMTAPYPESTTIQPIKRVIADFPDDMIFAPSKTMAICGDSQIGPPPVNMSVPPDEAISRCPNSVIGNGSTGIYFAKTNSPAGPTLKDVSLVVFNGGRDPQGRPVMKIYGYSATAQVGTFMVGTLKGNHLEVDVPSLPADSAVGEFHLEIPGSSSAFPNRRGQDPGYVVAKCSTGIWNTSTSLLIGGRDTAGLPDGGETIITAPPTSQDCKGARGKARLGKLGISGPGRSKPGKTAIYRLKITNTGTADIEASTVKVTGPGVSGKTKSGRIPAETSKTLKLKLRFSAKKHGNLKVKFRVAAGKLSKTAKKTVKLK